MPEMSEKLAHIRHSLAHLLAAAVMDLYPDTKRTIGPAIDDGFYFDFEFSKPITEDDLGKIEKKMKKIYTPGTSLNAMNLMPRRRRRNILAMNISMSSSTSSAKVAKRKSASTSRVSIGIFAAVVIPKA